MDKDIVLRPVFNIGQEVYYNLPDTSKGIVTDITFRLSSNIIWYHVTFAPEQGEIACREFELSTVKTVI